MKEKKILLGITTTLITPKNCIKKYGLDVPSLSFFIYFQTSQLLPGFELETLCVFY